MSAVRPIGTIAGLGEATGGTARAVVGHAAAWARAAGRPMTIVHGSRGGERPMTAPGVALRSVALGKGGLPVAPGFRGAITAALAAGTGPAVIHDNGLWLPANIAVARAARALKRPLVVSPHGMLEPWALSYKAWRKRPAWALYQRRILAGAAALHCSSVQEHDAVRALFPAIPIAVIANGVDIPPVITGPRPKTVLFLSRLHPKKNVPALVDAWAAAAPSGWRLRIAGPDEGGHRAEIEAHIRRHGAAAASISVEGQVAEADKASVFAEASLFVLPSLSENFGIVVAEAMAHGLPVIATRGTPWSDLPRAGAGWWVAPEPQALAGALREAIALPEAALAAMGERARRMAAERFGWSAIGEQLLRFYDWIAGGGPRPDFVSA